MVKNLVILIALLGVTSCSASNIMANNYCRDKFPGFINGSKTFDDCVSDKKADLIKNYKIYNHKVKQCWMEANKKYNSLISSRHIYAPSQKIYDRDRNYIGDTEEVDRYENEYDYEIEHKRVNMAWECIHKLGEPDELYKMYDTELFSL